MVAMHSTLLMATLVMLVEVAAMHNHMSLLLMVTMHTSIFMPMIPLMVLFAMDAVMIGVDDVPFS